MHGHLHPFLDLLHIRQHLHVSSGVRHVLALLHHLSHQITFSLHTLSIPEAHRKIEVAHIGIIVGSSSMPDISYDVAGYQARTCKA